MVDTREKFRIVLNDIAEKDGIKTFKQLSEMTGISANTFTRIKRNEVKEVDVETFRKLNAVFDNRYNVLWFQGDSRHMMVADYLAAKENNEEDITPRDERQLKITQRANDIQMTVLGHLVKKPEVKEWLAADDDPAPHLPTWADTLLGILSKQIAENEILHAELRQSISEVNEMKEKLSELVKNIK